MESINIPWALLPYEFVDLESEFRCWIVFDNIVQTLRGPRDASASLLPSPESVISIRARRNGRVLGARL